MGVFSSVFVCGVWCVCVCVMCDVSGVYVVCA